jgi:hypothetical protein
LLIYPNASDAFKIASFQGGFIVFFFSFFVCGCEECRMNTQETLEWVTPFDASI